MVTSASTLRWLANLRQVASVQVAKGQWKAFLICLPGIKEAPLGSTKNPKQKIQEGV